MDNLLQLQRWMAMLSQSTVPIASAAHLLLIPLGGLEGDRFEEHGAFAMRTGIAIPEPPLAPRPRSDRPVFDRRSLANAASIAGEGTQGEAGIPWSRVGLCERKSRFQLPSPLARTILVSGIGVGGPRS
jgi:hypothetical protein